MANTRVRLTQQTIDAVTELGLKCGVDDLDTVIKLLIRKYGDNLIDLLSPSNPIRDTLTLSIPATPIKEIELIEAAPIIPTKELNPGAAFLAMNLD